MVMFEVKLDDGIEALRLFCGDTSKKESRTRLVWVSASNQAFPSFISIPVHFLISASTFDMVGREH